MGGGGGGWWLEVGGWGCRVTRTDLPWVGTLGMVGDKGPMGVLACDLQQNLVLS